MWDTLQTCFVPRYLLDAGYERAESRCDVPWQAKRAYSGILPTLPYNEEILSLIAAIGSTMELSRQEYPALLVSIQPVCYFTFIVA